MYKASQFVAITLCIFIIGFAEAAFSKIPVYRDYPQVEQDLKSLAQKYPKITQLETYGVTGEGRNIYVLKISTEDTSAKPRLLITAATHGDELITTEMLFILTTELLEGYGKDPRFTQMINNRVLYIVPVVSPDSFEARERLINYVDPNRSFPGPRNSPVPQVDVNSAVMGLADKVRFTGSLDLHAYGRMVMYPWSYTSKPVPTQDSARFEELAARMALHNGYRTGPISQLIYPIEGSSADYYYWKYGTLAFGVEIGREKIPHWDKFPELANEVREMLWAFIEYF